ncbi:MAG TPA: hypothetical protein VHS06_03260 [Chloroflexota bacterium]|nr:hypothetical protein [Chloroflexota bacterium]HEX2987170.1 hypothetical protein [Chloroflexota bacterium]
MARGNSAGDGRHTEVVEMAQHPDEYRKDLNPDYEAGQNYGAAGEQAEEGAATAFDYKDMQELLPDWNGSDLRQLIIVPEGSRLQQGATYFDLRDPGKGEFTARGDMVAEPDSRLVPKDRTQYDLWNRLVSTGARR